MDHQLEAVFWMMNQEDSPIGGGINGDAMGLGKTGNNKYYGANVYSHNSDAHSSEQGQAHARHCSYEHHTELGG
jgi:hypothetical protein